MSLREVPPKKRLGRLKRRVRRLTRQVTLIENYIALATEKRTGCETDAVVQRVERLVTLAADPAASEAEARTSALIAAKTIKREHLKVCR